MEKMSCDIIQDLLPSYLDGICSAATTDCVENHLKSCANCREIAALCQKNVLTESDAEQKVLDGFRKTKEKMNYLFLGNIVLAILIFFGMQEFLRHTNALLLSFLLLFCVSMCVNLTAYAAMHAGKRPKKSDYLIGIFSIFATLFPALLFYFMCKKITSDGTILFGLEAAQCGPFLNKLFFFVFVLQLACFLYFLFRTNKREKNCTLLSCSALAGMFFMMAYRALLGRLDTPESFFTIFFQVNVIGTVIFGVGVFVGIFLVKRDVREQKGISE